MKSLVIVLGVFVIVFVIIPMLIIFLLKNKAKKQITNVLEYSIPYAHKELEKKIPGCEMSSSNEDFPDSDTLIKYINTNKIWPGATTQVVPGFKIAGSYNRVSFETYWIRKYVTSIPVGRIPEENNTFTGTYILFNMNNNGPDFLLCDATCDDGPDHTNPLNRTAIDEAKIEREKEKNSRFPVKNHIQDQSGYSYNLYLPVIDAVDECKNILDKLMHISKLLHDKYGEKQICVLYEDRKLVFSINNLLLMLPDPDKTTQETINVEMLEKHVDDDIDFFMEILKEITNEN